MAKKTTSTKKRVVKVEAYGEAHISSTFNNVIVTLTNGIGRSSARKILSQLDIDFDTKVGEWNDEQIAGIRGVIAEEYKIEGELRSSIQMNIKRLMDIGCYRGIRHRIGLPVRGQSTKNNARTRKGKKKTVANKKKATK